MSLSQKTTRRQAASQLASGLVAAASGSLLGFPSIALSQDKYPSKPITLIAPWPTGGSSDTVMRAIADSLGRALGGATVIVENRPGAGGTLGAAAMVNAKPDGYTLTQLPLGIYRIPHMQRTSFHPVNDITHIACLTGYAFVIAAANNAPFKTLKEMVAWAKANPGKLNYGHTGTGTTPHLAFEEFAMKAGFKPQDIPYKGTADLLPALLGGHIPVLSGSTEPVALAKEGKLRLLASYGARRNKAFNDVPTLLENGFDTVSESPFGIGGPKGIPKDIVKKLEVALKKTLDDPKLKDALDRFYQPVIWMDHERYSAYGARTYVVERNTVERLGLAKRD